MYWVWLALAAPTLWAASNLIDSSLLRETARSPAVLLAVTGAFAALPAIVMAVLGKFEWPNATVLLLAAITGVIGLLVYYPYYRALKLVSPAQAIIMWNLSPALVAIGALVLLHELLSMAQAVGVSLLIASSIATVPVAGVGGALRPAFGWMSIASLLLATQGLLEKALFEKTDLATGVAWMSLAAGLTAFALLASRRDTRRELWAAIAGRDGPRLLGNQLLDLGAALSLSVATSLGPVSIVHAIGGLQPVLVLLVGTAAAWSLRKSVSGNRPRWGRTVMASGLAMLGLALLYSPK
jgi:drug/metabolite transporter (DMT)-like permease